MDRNRELIDIAHVRHEAKAAWKKEQSARAGKFEQLGRSVPWWVVIIGAGLAALSAGHTAGVFNQLSPIGYAGPFVVEFGLLWAAFSRVIGQQEHSRLSSALRVLEALAFIMALISNAVGALDRVMANITPGELFGNLPIQTQAVVLVIPLFALFIPVGTWVAGEGIASLLYRGRESAEQLETQWAAVEYGELYRAFFDAYMAAGYRPGEAKRLASATASGATGNTGALSSPVTDSDSSDKTVSKRDEARRLLAEHPAYFDLSLRQLEAETGIDRNSWAIVKSEHRNGNHAE